MQGPGSRSGQVLAQKGNLKTPIMILMEDYKTGQRVFIVANGISIQQYLITRIEHDFYTLRGIDTMCSMRLRKHRLYKTKEEAVKKLNELQRITTGIQDTSSYRCPHYL